MPPQDTPSNPVASSPIRKILLVEDDLMIQELYATIFRFHKYEIDLAVDGVEGLEKCRSFKPDVVLLDVMMPRKNGIEMLQDMKNDPDLKNIPVIMLSNLADDEDIQKSLKLGALKYIIKSDYVPRQVVDIVVETVANQGKVEGQQPANG